MSSFENFVQCRIHTPLTASATDLAIYEAVAPYNLPPEAGGVLVLCDSPGNPSKIEVVRYSHRTDLGLYGLQRGQEGTIAVEWTGPTYCYQSLMADDFQALLDSKVDKSVAVSSVAGRTGDVLLSPADVGAQPASANLTNFASKKAPSGVVVGTTDTQTLTGKTISGGTYSGVIDQTGSVRANVVALAADTLNCSLGNYFTRTISANSTFAFSNVPASRAYSCTLELTHTGGTVTWPASVQWPGGTAPTLTTGKTHIFIFVTDDGGARWRGAALTNYTN